MATPKITEIPPKVNATGKPANINTKTNMKSTKGSASKPATIVNFVKNELDLLVQKRVYAALKAQAKPKKSKKKSGAAKK